MKYAIIIPDGAADEPLAELGGRTPIEAAHTPNMDRVAKEGLQGLARTVPDGFESGSLSAWSSSKGLTVQAGAAHNGSFGVRGQTASGVTWAKKTLPGSAMRESNAPPTKRSSPFGTPWMTRPPVARSICSRVNTFGRMVPSVRADPAERARSGARPPRSS